MIFHENICDPLTLTNLINKDYLEECKFDF